MALYRTRPTTLCNCSYRSAKSGYHRDFKRHFPTERVENNASESAVSEVSHLNPSPTLSACSDMPHPSWMVDYIIILNLSFYIKIKFLVNTKLGWSQENLGPHNKTAKVFRPLQFTEAVKALLEHSSAAIFYKDQKDSKSEQFKTITSG